MKDIKTELYKLGEMYRTSESEKAKEIYNEFAYLMILEQPLGEQSTLEKMWEWGIE